MNNLFRRWTNHRDLFPKSTMDSCSSSRRRRAVRHLTCSKVSLHVREHSTCCHHARRQRRARRRRWRRRRHRRRRWWQVISRGTRRLLAREFASWLLTRRRFRARPRTRWRLAQRRTAGRRAREIGAVRLATRTRVRHGRRWLAHNVTREWRARGAVRFAIDAAFGWPTVRHAHGRTHGIVARPAAFG